MNTVYKMNLKIQVDPSTVLEANHKSQGFAESISILA